MIEVKPVLVDPQRIVDEFSLEDLLAANKGKPWENETMLDPLEFGMVVVERIGNRRFLSIVTGVNDDMVQTKRGFVYTRNGVGLGIDGIHRSLTSPHYHIQRLERREEVAQAEAA